MSRPLSLECALGFIACTEYTCVPICDYRHKPECVYGDIPESLMSAINCSNWSKEDLYTRRSQQDWIFDLVRGRVEKSAVILDAQTMQKIKVCFNHNIFNNQFTVKGLN